MTTIPIPADAQEAAARGIPACRSALEQAAAAVAVSPSRLRSLPDCERIAELTAEEYEAERAGERRVDAAEADS